MSVEFTPTMMVRKRTVWLADHPGAMVEDFDRQPGRPFIARKCGRRTIVLADDLSAWLASPA